MTKLWTRVLVVAAMLATCEAQDVPEPPYSMWVDVADDAGPQRTMGTHEVVVRVHAARMDKKPADCSLILSCSAFDGTGRISMGEVALLREVSEAAKAGVSLRKENFSGAWDGSKEAVIESVLRDDRWVVTMTCGQREAVFDPGEAERLDRKVAEGRAGLGWYRALFVKGVKPEETAEIHPPVSDGMTFMWGVGKTEVKGLLFSSIIRIFPDRKNSRISWGVGAEKRSVGGGWALELPGRIAEALAAIRAGKPYLFEHEYYSVLGNRDTREAEIALDKGLRGSFDEANLAELEKLKAKGEARMLWLQQNERLFFKPVEKIRED